MKDQGVVRKGDLLFIQYSQERAERSMKSLRLRVFPDPVLREETLDVSEFGEDLKDLVAEMVRQIGRAHV